MNRAEYFIVPAGLQSLFNGVRLYCDSGVQDEPCEWAGGPNSQFISDVPTADLPVDEMRQHYQKTGHRPLLEVEYILDLNEICEEFAKLKENTE